LDRAEAQTNAKGGLPAALKRIAALETNFAALETKVDLLADVGTDLAAAEAKITTLAGQSHVEFVSV